MSSSGKEAANGKEETHRDDGSSTGKVNNGAAEETGTAVVKVGRQDGNSEDETPEEAVGARRPVAKQAAKSRSFNDRHVKKQPDKSAGASPPGSNTPHSELKSKPRRGEASSKSDAEEQSSARDEKPRKPGTLPKYDLTFRCMERAEKRKEFFSKLEEKIQAKEVEKSTLEAKAKEKEEAEIKTLRKNLIFKANPLPSFYQEPPPPKPKLKKIPTTKPKSPKLSRGRTLATSDSEDHSCSSARSGRQSLDGKMAKSRIFGGASPVQEKQSVRKSLHKPASEKISLPVQENSPEKSTPAAEPGVCQTSEKSPQLEEPASS